MKATFQEYQDRKRVSKQKTKQNKKTQQNQKW